MKLRLLAVILVFSLLLTACAANTTDAPTAGSTQEPVTAADTQPGDATGAEPDPTEGEEENLDIFGVLYPEDGTIPRGKELIEYAQQLAENTSRISQIEYTWRNGRPSMEVLAGTYDEYHTYEVPAESPMELVYGESEYYNYVLYLPDGYDPADTAKKWPVIYFFHGIGERGDDQIGRAHV